MAPQDHLDRSFTKLSGDIDYEVNRLHIRLCLSDMQRDNQFERVHGRFNALTSQPNLAHKSFELVDAQHAVVVEQIEAVDGKLNETDGRWSRGSTRCMDS